MLDIRTLLVVTFALTLALGIAFAIVWRGQPGLPGVRHWAVGCLLTGIGLLLLALRGVISDWLSVALANIVVIAGQGVMVLAVADVLQWPQPRRVVYGTVVAALLFWPTALLLVPQDLGLRVTVYACIVILQFVYMAWMLVQAQALPRLPRWIFAAVQMVHITMVVLRGITGLFITPGDGYFDPNVLNAVWALENAISVVAFTVCFAVLLGARLTHDIEQQNLALGQAIGGHRQLQAQLRESLDQEAAMRHEQQQFINRATGEFEAPLRAIGARAAQLRAELQGAMQQNAAPRLYAIEGAVRRLRRLIETFLIDRRVQGGMAEMRQENIDLAALLAEVVREQGRPGARPGAEWRLQFQAPDGPLPARGDAAMLAVVFGNLIDNALKYSDPEAPVGITLARQGDEVVVTVQDRGIGIPERDLGTIGQRFFRAGNTAGVPGTGLGLFSAGRLIQFHGGRFVVESQPGQGSRFQVLLPLGQLEGPGDAA